jgi:NADH:ubiquinone oxidoreductase subunit F (NADH-binding)/(2Fe-2S) ferredoxin
MKIQSLDDLRKMKEEYGDRIYGRVKNDYPAEKTEVLIGMATCGVSSGSKETLQAFEEAIVKNHIKDVQIVPVGCLGLCHGEPLVQVNRPREERVLYGNVSREKVVKIVEEHLISGKIVEGLLYENQSETSNSAGNTFEKQVRIALQNCGVINPEDIQEYIAVDGYESLGKVLFTMTPEETIREVKDSGLRGRGGGGFSTGLKWEITRNQPHEKKFIICNADEGDPGAFMDRSILEGDPHCVIEGMAIGGYAIGAREGIIYIRAEYPLAIERIHSAIYHAREWGILGENIMGSNFSFDIKIKFGAGAFVCGEETALINSCEGKRGEPNYKPPYPAEEGYWGNPTCVNNVETFANVPRIILKGRDWFSSIGTEKSKGTKVFALTGKVNHVGLVEIPMGTTLRDVIFDIGGGIRDGKRFKAVQTGGPSGGVIPEEHLDIPIDYESLREIGSMMGSGGMIVMDETDNMVDIAKFYLEFSMEESCGRCTPCRIGTKRLYEKLSKISRKKGTMEDIDQLKTLAQMVRESSLCGLGQTSPNPVVSTLKYFWQEYQDLIQ